MLTIKEFADSLNLPKSKINYQVSKLDTDYIVVLNGIKHLTKEAQNSIKQALGIEKEIEDDSTLNTNLDNFEHFFKHFEPQLNAKNQQIDRLHTLLDQQQQLTLQRDKQIEKLQLQLENNYSKKNENEETNIEKPLQDQEQQTDQIRQELEQKNIENEQLKKKIDELQQAPKKGFWQRLFKS